jgi:hypothetical protein
LPKAAKADGLLIMLLLVCCPAAYGKDGQQYSLLEYILRETEQLHGSVRRYTSPDEQAFYPGVCEMQCSGVWLGVCVWHTLQL